MELSIYSGVGICGNCVCNEEAELGLDDSNRGVWAQKDRNIVTIVLQRFLRACYRCEDYNWLLISQNHPMPYYVARTEVCQMVIVVVVTVAKR